MVFSYNEAIQFLKIVTVPIIRLMETSENVNSEAPYERNSSAKRSSSDPRFKHDNLIILDHHHDFQPSRYLEKLLNCWSNNPTFCSGVDSKDNTNLKNENSSFRQRRLTQGATSVTEMLIHNHPVDNPEISNDHIFSHAIYATSLQTENNSNVHRDNEDTIHGCAIFTCHGMEPKALNQSILVEEMYCASMMNDYMNKESLLKPIKQNAILSFFSNLFSGYSLHRPADGFDAPKPPSCLHTALTCSKINQDRAHIVTTDCNASIILGVYDGHGDKGELVADYIMRSVERKLPQKYSIFHSLSFHPAAQQSHDLAVSEQTETSIQSLVHNSTPDNSIYIQGLCTGIFREIDMEISQQQHLRPMHSGSTACIVLLSPSKLYVANVGDSRAVLGYRTVKDPVFADTLLQTIELTKDQNAYDPIERQRILEAGGYVTLPKKGFENEVPARVWLDERCTQIGLGMSRSFGDFALKDVGVIVDPIVTSIDIDQGHEFLIVATDGVWEFIESDEAVNIISSCFERGQSASEACEELILCAKDRWRIYEGQYRDDITAIIIRLHDIWTKEGQINYNRVG